MGFHQEMWDAWLNGHLNWQDFDFDDIPGASEEELDRWNNDQKWPLQDKNQFYYPLFGLGNKESDIAFVAAGPGHNVGLAKYNDTTRGRRRIFGPEKNRAKWTATNPTEHYLSEFEQQKRRWEKNRLELYNDKNESHNLTKYLTKIISDIPALGSELYQEAYITNFLKDGEFKKSGLDYEDELLEDLYTIERIRWASEIKQGLSFSRDQHDTCLFVSNRWHDLKSNSSKPRKVCELASREFWLPFLGLELSEINPELVVPIGVRATEAIYHLYELEDDIAEPPLDGDGNKIETTLRNTLDGQPDVLPSYHWGRGKINEDKLSNQIAEYFEDVV